MLRVTFYFRDGTRLDADVMHVDLPSLPHPGACVYIYGKPAKGDPLYRPDDETGEWVLCRDREGEGPGGWNLDEPGDIRRVEVWPLPSGGGYAGFSADLADLALIAHTSDAHEWDWGPDREHAGEGEYYFLPDGTQVSIVSMWDWGNHHTEHAVSENAKGTRLEHEHPYEM